MNSTGTCVFAELMVFLLLAGAAVPDLKRKRIPVFPVLFSGAAGIAVRQMSAALPECMQPGGLADGLWGLLPGALVVLLAFLSRQAIGYGDGMILGACGCWLGMKRTLEIFFLASVGAAVFAGILLLRKKADRKDSLPFLPFLAAAQGAVLVWTVCGGWR